jgi:hypothetical protein
MDGPRLTIGCGDCGHIACVCDVKARHEETCRFRFAVVCAVGIACQHGHEVCPICDTCTCASIEVDPDAFGVVPASSVRGGPKDMWAVTYRGQTLGRFDHFADAEADMLDRYQRATREVSRG